MTASTSTMTSLPTSDRSWPNPTAAKDLGALRAQVPLVQCITNIVVTNFTANVLLAIGASPAMVIAEQEVEFFAGIASALLINVGTITQVDAPAMLKAAKAAQAAGTPWVLDPVAVGALVYRTEVVDELLGYGPTIIRGNGSEIGALAGGEGGKGADSTQSSSAAVESGIDVARKTGAVVAISGEVDYITDGKEVITVGGGHVLMTRITGTGCSLGATMAAFAAVADTPLDAAASASAVFAQAAERGMAVSNGPGTLAPAFLDNLASVKGTGS
jgi:hydroxyethylthiazole kinase